MYTHTVLCAQLRASQQCTACVAHRMPLLYLVALLVKWWYESILILAVQTAAGYWGMFALPFQLAFQNPVTSDSTRTRPYP